MLVLEILRSLIPRMEELVLIRLACLARVEDRSAYRQLQDC